MKDPLELISNIIQEDARVGLRRFALDENTGVLVFVHVPEEPVRFIGVKGKDGFVRPATKDDVGARIYYAIPVFSYPGGWSVLIGSNTRGSLFLNMMLTLQGMGTLDEPLYVQRTGSGRSTTYHVMDGRISRLSHMIPQAKEAYRKEEPPSEEQIKAFLETIFSRRRGEDEEE